MPRRAAKVSPRAAFIRGLAAVQGKSLAAIQAKSGVHASVFYRVVRGERTSRRVDGAIARELGIRQSILAGLKDGAKAARK